MANNLNTSYIQNGITADIQKVQNQYTVGVSFPVLCQYDVIPLAANASLIASSALVSGLSINTPLVLNSANVTQGLGGNGVSLDCQRAVGITITITGGTAPYTLSSACTAVCVGYDDRDVQLVATMTIASGTTIATPGGTAGIAQFGFPKMFSRVNQVYFTALPAVSSGTASVSVGTGCINGIARNSGSGVLAQGIDAFGLPFFAPRPDLVQNITWGSDYDRYSARTTPNNPSMVNIPIVNPFFSVSAGAATPVNIPGYNPSYLTGTFVSGYQFNPYGATTVGAPAAPSALTNQDARGYVMVPNVLLKNNTQGGANGQLVPNTNDGMYPYYNMLSVLYYVYGADSYVQAQLQAAGNLAVQNPSTVQRLLLQGTNVPSAQMKTGILPSNSATTSGAINLGQLLARDEVGLQYFSATTPGV